MSAPFTYEAAPVLGWPSKADGVEVTRSCSYVQTRTLMVRPEYSEEMAYLNRMVELLKDREDPAALDLVMKRRDDILIYLTSLVPYNQSQEKSG